MCMAAVILVKDRRCGGKGGRGRSLALFFNSTERIPDLKEVRTWYQNTKLATVQK